MLSVDAALERMLSGLLPTTGEPVALDRCLGRVPASFNVTATIDVPPFANSAMDGFAVRAADLPATLRIVGEVAAGAVSLPQVGAGNAARIMTGAPLPPGADTIIPLEDATEGDGVVRAPTAPLGAHVREAGHDTPAGQTVQLPMGPLTPATIAVLASVGLAELSVRRRPRVAILSTGDELLAPGTPLGPGQIYDANSPALAAAVREAGGEPLPLPLTGDDPTLIERRLADGAADGDLLVISGGVSVGRHDHVRAAIQRLGSLEFWRIAVQPGKPLAFGTLGGRPVVGLPGNPVSALLTFEIFVRPMLRTMQGLTGDGRLRVAARAAERIAKDPDRRAYLRVRLSATEHGYEARSAGGQLSSQLRPLADANALLVVPEGSAAAEPGCSYPAIVLGALA